MSTVILAVFNDYPTADRVREALVRDGFPTDRVELTASDELGRAAYEPADTPHGKYVQYFRVLLGGEEQKESSETLAQRVESGAAAITVHPRGAIETARATQLLQQAHPVHLIGHELTKHGWEHAAARHESAWAKHVWLEHSPDDPDCIYCRLFSDRARHTPAASTSRRSGAPAAAQTVAQASSLRVADSNAFVPGARGAAAALLPRAVPLEHIGIRRVPAFESLKWLRRGWDDLWHVRSASLIHGALIATLGAVLLMLGSTHPYFIAAAVSGYLLVGPIMTTGMCELSRRRAAGESLGFDESLQAVTRNAQELFKFGAILAAIAIVWFAASEAMLRSVLHSAAPTAAQVIWGGLTDVTNRGEIIAYVGSGAVLAVLVFAVSVVAVPLIIDRRARATDAMWVSVKATLWNLPAMLVWSALIVLLTALGFGTLLVGMVLVAPLLGHATWHAYRSLVE